MKKYLIVAQNTWDEMLTYRLNFIMFRLRNVLTFITIYYLWIALIPQNGQLFGYSQSMMLTYVVGTAFLAALVMASQSYTIGDDINQGNLSNYLIRPMYYFFYWAAKDIGDKAMNISFAIVELSLLYIILRPPIYVQTDIRYLLLFVLCIVMAMVLYFLCNILLGMIAFWSSEVWAPRFIFMILVSFFAGNYFPLDILPDYAYRIFTMLPFQYLTYFPLKVYLQQVTINEALIGIGIGLLWCGVLLGFAQWLWHKGLYVYTAQGK